MAGFLGTFNAVSRILSARAIAMVGTIGAGFLTWSALDHADPDKLVALGIYCAGLSVVVWLSGR